MEFKDAGKRKDNGNADTLYFNAYTEDLFTWENDLDGDTARYLQINNKSNFFNGLIELALDETIAGFLSCYADFEFDISFCLQSLNNEENEALYNRALNLLSHGKYAIYEPIEMGDDNKILFRSMLRDFLVRFGFYLPEILPTPALTTAATLTTGQTI